MIPNRQKTASALSALLVCVCLQIVCSGAGFAASYIVDDNGRRIPSPDPYLVYEVIDGRSVGVGSFHDPSHFILLDDGSILVADTGNSRLVHISADRSSARQITPADVSGGLVSPSGIAVANDGNLWVADLGAHRVVKMDLHGNVSTVLTEPTLWTGTSSIAFRPIRVLQDSSGTVYVANEGDYRGLFTYRENGTFRGFHGANMITVNLRFLLWRLVMTPEQWDIVKRGYVPSAVSDMAFNRLRQIYTVSGSAMEDQIRLLNVVGGNVYERGQYGEYEFIDGVFYRPNLSGIAVDNDGIITVCDTNTGKIYQYNASGELLLVFGGKGENTGSFGQPIALQVARDGDIYVMDRARGDIQVFRPTHFARLIHQASALHDAGRYVEARSLWESVLVYSAHHLNAHRGIAEAQMKLKDFKGAMESFRRARDEIGYSRAFAKYRRQYLRERFTAVVFGGLALFVFVRLLLIALQRVAAKPAGRSEYADERYSVPEILLGILLNPARMLEAIRQSSKWHHGVILLIALVAVRILGLYLTSYHFAGEYVQETTMSREVLQTFVPIVAWCIASYAVSTVMYGRGRAKDVFVATGYCLAPYLLFSLPLALLTQVFSLDEAWIYNLLQASMWGWVVLLVFLQMIYLHDFSPGQAVGVTFMSLFAIAASFGLIGLVYALTWQNANLVKSIALEVSMR